MFGHNGSSKTTPTYYQTNSTLSIWLRCVYICSVPGYSCVYIFELFEIETSHRIIRIESCAKFLQFKDLFFISSDLQGCVHIDACLSAGTSQARVNVNATHAKKSSFRTPFVFFTTTKFSTLLTISSSRGPKIDLRC